MNRVDGRVHVGRVGESDENEKGGSVPRVARWTRAAGLQRPDKVSLLPLRRGSLFRPDWFVVRMKKLHLPVIDSLPHNSG